MEGEGEEQGGGGRRPPLFGMKGLGKKLTFSWEGDSGHLRQARGEGEGEGEGGGAQGVAHPS